MFLLLQDEDSGNSEGAGDESMIEVGSCKASEKDSLISKPIINKQSTSRSSLGTNFRRCLSLYDTGTPVSPTYIEGMRVGFLPLNSMSGKHIFQPVAKF